MTRLSNLWLFVLLLLNNDGNVSLPVHHTLHQLLYYLRVRTQHSNFWLQIKLRDVQ